jgi:hypothetical protein
MKRNGGWNHATDDEPRSQSLSPIIDPDGTVLSNSKAALIHGLQVARELMFKRPGMLGQPWSAWTMRVNDKDGKTIHTSFADVPENNTKHWAIGEKSDGCKLKGTAIDARALFGAGATWSDPMKIRPKGPEERSRCGHGIVTDLRGQDQAADGSRAQQVSTANESVEPRRQRNLEFRACSGW